MSDLDALDNVIKIPLVKIGNYIGLFGEMIITAFFELHNIFILKRNFSLEYSKGRCDFLITNNEDKKEKYFKLEQALREFDNNDKYKIHEILETEIPKIKLPLKIMLNGIEYEIEDKEEFYNFEYDYEAVKREISQNYPNAIIKMIHKDTNVVFYDISPLVEQYLSFIKNNLCKVEVKTSIGSKFLKLSGKGKTTLQKEEKYYDYLLRVKIQTDFSNGLIGEINVNDITNLFNDERLKK